MLHDFKLLPLEVAARDGRARRTVLAAIDSAALNWAGAETAIGRLIREQKALRSTERRFVGEAAWSLIRRYEPLRMLARKIAPEADSSRIHLLMYFLHLALDRGAPAEVLRPHLEETGLPTDVETWPAAWQALLDSASNDDARFSLQHGMPLWFVRRLRAAYGDEAAALADALNHRAAVDLRVNINRAGRDDMRERIRFEGVSAQATPYSPWGLRIDGHVNVNSLPSYRDGLIDVQDEGSQLLALFTGGAPGETVLDLCAGGGGKLVALTPLVLPGGHMIACDISRPRLTDAEKRLQRLKLPAADARVLPGRNAGSSSALDDLQGACDRVLVDAPCSGTGAWRRHPSDRWRINESEIEKRSATQRDVLETAAKLVKPGGRLVYATCSILPDENEMQAEWFAAAYPDYVLQNLATLLPGLGERISDSTGRYLKVLPHKQGTDGFFAAAFIRAK